MATPPPEDSSRRAPLPRRVAVVGCGLIGGSLLRALRAAGIPELLAVDRDAATRALVAASLGIAVHERPDAALRDCDVVVLALPVGALLESLAPVGSLLAGSAAVLTDVGGVKEPVLRAAAHALPPAVPFVGGHPMAGKEKGGFDHSDAELFRARTVALCPGPSAAPAAVERVRALWLAVGARTVLCTPEAHDRAVARVSHVPHLVASVLARVAASGGELAGQLAAGGLRDSTRVAEDPTIRQALTRNPHVAEVARTVADELRRLAERIEEGDSIDALLDEGAAARRRLFGG